MTSILAGLTKRDEELEEKAKEWESEKIAAAKEDEEDQEEVSSVSKFNSILQKTYIYIYL